MLIYRGITSWKWGITSLYFHLRDLLPLILHEYMFQFEDPTQAGCVWSVPILDLLCTYTDACSSLIISIWHVVHTYQRLTGWLGWARGTLQVHTSIELLLLWQFIYWSPRWVLRHSSGSCLLAHLPYLSWLPLVFVITLPLIDDWLSTLARGGVLLPSILLFLMTCPISWCILHSPFWGSFLCVLALQWLFWWIFHMDEHW